MNASTMVNSKGLLNLAIALTPKPNTDPQLPPRPLTLTQSKAPTLTPKPNPNPLP